MEVRERWKVRERQRKKSLSRKPRETGERFWRKLRCIVTKARGREYFKVIHA